MEVKTVFDFAKNILEKTGDCTLDGTDFALYNPQMILQLFGYDPDISVLIMKLNISSNMPKKWHYTYLYYAIPKQHKLGGWFMNNKKFMQTQKDRDILVNAISYLYCMSKRNAEQAIIVFNKKEREQLVSDYKQLSGIL